MTRPLLLGLFFLLFSAQTAKQRPIQSTETLSAAAVCIEEVNAAVERSDYETAIALTTHSVRYHSYTDEQLPELLLEITRALQPEHAWKLLTEALAHQEHGPQLHRLARLVLQKNGDVLSALEFANAVIQQDPDSPRSYEVLAAAAVSMPELAKSLHESSFALAPADGERYVYLAHTLRDLGEFEDAIAAVNKAMELEQPDPAHHEALATIFFDMHDEATALQHIRAAAELNGEGAEHWFPLGLIYSDLSEITDAIYAFRNAIQYDTQNADAHYQLGQAYIRNEQLTEAVAAYEAWTEAMPDSGRAYHELALAYKLTGEPNRARTAFAQAQKLEPDNTTYAADADMGRIGYNYVSTWDKVAAGIVALGLIATFVSARRRATRNN